MVGEKEKLCDKCGIRVAEVVREQWDGRELQFCRECDGQVLETITSADVGRVEDILGDIL